MATMIRQSARGNRMTEPRPVFEIASIAFVERDGDAIRIAFDPPDDARRYILRLTDAEWERIVERVQKATR